MLTCRHILILRRSVTQRPISGQPVRGFADHIRVSASNGAGTLRIPLNSPKVVGIATSRGSRGYQEDTHSVASVELKNGLISRTLERISHEQCPWTAPDEESTTQMVFAGIYDGHGGPTVSQYLQENLHGILESADPKAIPTLIAALKEYGGYFRRFRGGVLEPWANPETETAYNMTLQAYLTLAFLQADNEISKLPEAEDCGATASVALIQSLDEPATPFYSSECLFINVAHCGDTRALLCKTDGTSTPMTVNHHADERGESTRLRKMGGATVMDSFGDTRFMGALANTRCLGDSRYRPFGVTPEPEIRNCVVRGDSVSSMILISDGISSLLTDNEVSDLVRSVARYGPQTGAKEVIDFAEELGAEDNCTVVVIPLPGWSVKVRDSTKELREYRLSGAARSGRQRRM